jgi:hypothetical protein
MPVPFDIIDKYYLWISNRVAQQAHNVFGQYVRLCR